MDDLAATRLRNARASGGISNSAIKAMVYRMIADLSCKGSLLDFGAGTGELLKVVVDSGQFKKLSGADILDRPLGLDPSITWYNQDLNDVCAIDDSFDLVVATEVIEHLENPRAMVRNIYRLLRPGGWIIITTPNQESIRSYAALLGGGHFAAFLGRSYPAHITALLRLDLYRILTEIGFRHFKIYYTNHGGIPKFPGTTWQELSFGLLGGRLFSDNIGIYAQKPNR